MTKKERNAIIEKCAKIADEVAIPRRSYMEGQSIASWADVIAARIRKLKEND